MWNEWKRKWIFFFFESVNEFHIDFNQIIMQFSASLFFQCVTQYIMAELREWEWHEKRNLKSEKMFSSIKFKRNSAGKKKVHVMILCYVAWEPNRSMGAYISLAGLRLSSNKFIRLCSFSITERFANQWVIFYAFSMTTIWSILQQHADRKEIKTWEIDIGNLINVRSLHSSPQMYTTEESKDIK